MRCVAVWPCCVLCSLCDLRCCDGTPARTSSKDTHRWPGSGSLAELYRHSQFVLRPGNRISAPGTGTGSRILSGIPRERCTGTGWFPVAIARVPVPVEVASATGTGRFPVSIEPSIIRIYRYRIPYVKHRNVRMYGHLVTIAIDTDPLPRQYGHMDNQTSACLDNRTSRCPHVQLSVCLDIWLSRCPHVRTSSPPGYSQNKPSSGFFGRTKVPPDFFKSWPAFTNFENSNAGVKVRHARFTTSDRRKIYFRKPKPGAKATGQSFTTAL